MSERERRRSRWRTLAGVTAGVLVAGLVLGIPLYLCIPHREVLQRARDSSGRWLATVEHVPFGFTQEADIVVVVDTTSADADGTDVFTEYAEGEKPVVEWSGPRLTIRVAPGADILHRQSQLGPLEIVIVPSR